MANIASQFEAERLRTLHDIPEMVPFPVLFERGFLIK
jgi:hypothetical protein